MNHRKVSVSTKDLTLDARFTIAAELRNQAASRQSQGREAVLAKKRGLPPPAVAPSKQVLASPCTAPCGAVSVAVPAAPSWVAAAASIVH
jgi:hypothetical protein